jgi:hypothetical protein
MKNYLMYPDCFSVNSINQCRFALLTLSGSYNLMLPANIRVLVHTNKATAAEIFEPFLKGSRVVHHTTPVQEQNPVSLPPFSDKQPHKTFFVKNWKKSMANLVNKTSQLDLKAVTEVVETTVKLPFLQRWMQKWRGKTSLYVGTRTSFSLSFTA